MVDPSLIAAFRRDGHVTVPGLAPPAEVAAIRPAVAAVVDAVAAAGDPQGRIDDYGELFTQVTNAWRHSAPVRAFVFAPRFAEVAAALLGVEGVRLYHDQALVKEPGGRGTPWHQDQYYWPLDTEDTVTLWMPLVDVTTDMGPMVFATGSHAMEGWALRPIGKATDAALADEIRRRGLPIGGGRPLRAGDATFHRGRTVHAAGPNRSATRREVMTVIYFADGARVVEPDNDHRRADRDAFLPGLAGGDLAASPLNPVLYPVRTTPAGRSSGTTRSRAAGTARRSARRTGR
jgi:ectoine hydroxylase-related dioxygenase (phytanoyl-CoA dioxygenase family)